MGRQNRNMGGEAIKPDRWIIEFELWYSTTQESMEDELLRLKIPLGLFDIVFWCYCEKFVSKVDKLPEHFAAVFNN